MILKGNQRANGRELALHLLNVDDNEHAVVHELRGFLSDDLIDAFRETEAISLGTKCQQYLFSLSLNPPTSATVSIDEFERAIAEIERRLGLTGQPRAVVFHEKHGRRHAHCVWSRIDVDRMRAINLPHFKRRLMDISRELYLEHDWDMPAGLRHAEDRDPSNFSGAEASQAKRTKRSPAELKKLFKTCWEMSDSRIAFAAALHDKGFCLARGDRRGFVAVDVDGEVYSLSRWCEVKAKDLRNRLGNWDDLPDVETAIDQLTAKPSPTDDQSANFQRERQAQQDAHERKRTELVAVQREARLALQTSQEQRRRDEILERQALLPTGLKAAWARLSGQYHRLCEELATKANGCQARDRAEMQSLINRHLAERRDLDREWAFREAQFAMQQELHRAFSVEPTRIYSLDPRQPLQLPREDALFTRDQLAARPDLILAHINDKKARFNRTDILRGLSEYISDPLDLRLASDQVLASSKLVRVDGGTSEEFTTQDFLEVEQGLAICTAEMARSGGFQVKPSNTKRAIKRENTKLQARIGAELSNEQITAIHHILSPNQLCSIVGLAGAGKSTLLSVAREAWERQGYRVHGAALAGKAADSLQSASGISSRTLASLEASWKSGYEPVACGDVVVIDEAGMVGTRQLARVAEQLRSRGCKLVLVGDPDQLQPIQAGTPFRDITENIGAALLTEIRRQTSEWQRKASQDLARGQASAALQTYADHGAVHEAQDIDHAITALVDSYVADWRINGHATSRLALAHRRVDVHAINQAIKAARSVQDDETAEILIKTDHGPRAFSEDDRILFTRNDATLGVRNGMLGTVKKIGDRQLVVDLDPDESGQSRKLAFSPREFPSIDHGFAVSIHRSQGCTVDRSFVLSSTTLDKNLTYVALTRHKEETGFYVAPEIAPRRQIALPAPTNTRRTRPRGPSMSR
ncbi:AAA family ATPase [Sulfitobacter geojensis]|uniref:AAA family ATPase n=1 Tax=Sulfitobacter geojensis TaxID=1342299 RepID=UPI000467FD6B|nr:AAA family ATPase [Sulfitobacter geojensis]KHA51923.1 Ti-type conjugative transfer relaxase TraA [Sulfitobacter geojensis]NYI29330.1 Ti-type conjugative transfer relaxase TraA [Sulfitobacter geojensis]